MLSSWIHFVHVSCQDIIIVLLEFRKPPSCLAQPSPLTCPHLHYHETQVYITLASPQWTSVLCILQTEKQYSGKGKGCALMPQT